MDGKRSSSRRLILRMIQALASASGWSFRLGGDTPAGCPPGLPNETFVGVVETPEGECLCVWETDDPPGFVFRQCT